jgi:hypothetical protein
MSINHMTDPLDHSKWYICEKAKIVRGTAPIEPQQHDLRLESFLTEEEAKEKLPYWQRQEGCHEPFIRKPSKSLAYSGSGHRSGQCPCLGPLSSAP